MFFGLIYRHQKEVIRRDLKVDNVLEPDVYDRVKLCDFGISRVMNPRSPCARWARP